jgi:ABC-2 type transport system permease protein
MSLDVSSLRPHRVGAVILRHMYELRRNANHITNMVYWPVVNIVVWGFFTIYLRRDATRPGLVNCLLGAVILWGIFNGFQRDMAVGFLDELWSRNLVSLFASPLSVPEYLIGLVAVNAIKVMIGVGFEAIIALLFYHFDIFPMLPRFVPFILNLALFALAIGIAVTGLIFRYTTRFQTLAWSFAGILMPLSCVFYPLDALPKFLRPIAWLLPTTHCFEGMRRVMMHGELSLTHFGWGLALNVWYFGFAMLFFNWMFNSARARGLLVKME